MRLLFFNVVYNTQNMKKIIVLSIVICVLGGYLFITTQNDKNISSSSLQNSSVPELLSGTWILDTDNQYVMEINNDHYIVVFRDVEIESGFISSYINTPNGPDIAATTFIDPRRNIERSFTVSELNEKNLTLFLSDIDEKKERTFTRTENSF